MSKVQTFKVTLVGDAGVVFFFELTATLYVLISFYRQNHGQIFLEIWEIPGSLDTPETRAGFLQQSDAAIIMFDLTCKTTFDSVIAWHQELISTISPTLPIVVCGNKADKDEKSREIDTGTLEWPSQMQGIQYYNISAKTTLNLEAPFLWILRQLLPEPTVEFVFAHDCIGRMWEMNTSDLESLQKYRKEMEAVAAMPLPDEDECDL
ncbi:GTP-binding nuclear protein gsp1/Ran [Penicillium alfredii]|uniref:GTP-binding nuclear protein gsp1/Ran n=1 Tax=Penicillium alfredii TaxID=1506179 RepID=A0A9W9KGS4_9EURO|nr:GTP-binding nuclear protein gsp1/Ran [Penicillium alfredii]KAJ5104983.1 GTP-binding nuclear protein gsp1/Ran [Penicillium alfredii]